MVEDPGDGPDEGARPGDPAGYGGEPVNLVTELFVLTRPTSSCPTSCPSR
jgi:hypothetical protein